MRSLRGLAIAMAAATTVACGRPPQGALPPPAKAAPCLGCHATAERATAPIFPVLAGQHAAYLEAQLKAFRSGERKNAIMNGVARTLSDDEIAALSAYYESLAPVRGALTTPTGQTP